MNRYLKSMLCTAALAAFSAPAAADTITFAGAGTTIGNGAPAQRVDVSAEAIFDISGDLLTVTLRNTSGPNNKTDTAKNTLTGVFWDLSGDPRLTTVSAQLASGSSIYKSVACSSTCDGATDLSGEFGYQERDFAGEADRGIASANYLQTGLQGNIGNFNNNGAGPNLDDPRNINGINFGIISNAAGFNPNEALSNVPLVQDAAVFTLRGVNGLTIADIAHVSFQFGTIESDFNLPANQVPEPLTGALLGVGLLGMAAVRRRRRA